MDYYGLLIFKKNLIEYGFFFFSSFKTGYPSRNDGPSCEYSRMDFDSDEEFGSFFNCKLCFGMLTLWSTILGNCQ